MPNLYDITEQHRGLQLLAESDEMPEDAIKDTFEGLEGEFNEKAISLIHVINNIDADLPAINEAIKRLTARKVAIENRKESLREYLRTNMEATGITKISCPLFGISLAKGRDSVVIDDEDAIPDDLMAVSVVQKPDKKEILRRLQAGDDVPGARIHTPQKSLRIK